MKTLGAGKIINVKCDEILIPEFPLLSFGKHSDGSSLFDATSYLTQKAPNGQSTVEDFFLRFDFQIKAIATFYGIPIENMVFINSEGHQLIDGCLCYLFLSYVEPQFCAYCNDIVSELFANGMVISDTRLIALIKQKLSPELLKQIWDNEKDMA